MNLSKMGVLIAVSCLFSVVSQAETKDRVEGGPPMEQYYFNPNFGLMTQRGSVQICIMPKNGGRIEDFDARAVATDVSPQGIGKVAFVVTPMGNNCAVVGCSGATAYYNCAGYAMATAREVN
jgi:hypothetical protein